MSMLSGYPNTKLVPNPQPTGKFNLNAQPPIKYSVYMSDPRQSGGNMDADGYI